MRLGARWWRNAAVAWVGVFLAAHATMLAGLPSLISLLTLNKAGLERNRLYHGKVKLAPKDIVPYDNSFNMSSFLVYDVSDGPMRLHAKVPDGVPYWSVGVNGFNTDQLFVINDMQLPQREATLVMVHEGQAYKAAPAEHVVVSPSEVGFVLIRMLLPRTDDPKLVERLAAVQAQAWARPAD